MPESMDSSLPLDGEGRKIGAPRIKIDRHFVYKTTQERRVKNENDQNLLPGCQNHH